MGTVYRRGSRYYISVTDPRSGRRIRRSAGATRQQAEIALARVLAGCSGPLRLPDLLEAYLEHLRVHAKRSSRSQAAVGVRHLVRILGPTPARLLTSADLDRFITTRRTEGALPQTINGSLRILRAALRLAVEERRLSDLPVRIRLLRTPRKRSLPVLGQPELVTLATKAREPFPGVLLVCGLVGLRLSEALHLRWGDVDLREGRLAVVPRPEWAPKGYDGRVVYAPEFLCRHLKTRARHAAPTLPADLVFPGPKGAPYSRETASAYIRDAFKAAGVYRRGYPTAHWLRHSFCSRLLQAGVDLETVRRVMGHRDLTTTLLYVHTDDHLLRQAARRLEHPPRPPTAAGGAAEYWPSLHEGPS